MKTKTHSGTKKRFKISSTGKVLRRQAGKRHLNEGKTSRRTRRLMGDAVLDNKAEAKTVKRLLGR